MNVLRRKSKLPTERQDDLRDLGFGSKVAQQSTRRFLNRDGSFNVSRHGLSFFRSLSIYHALLTMSWWRFLSLVIGFYFAANFLFAFGYLLCGPSALQGSSTTTAADRLAEAFFFSVQTFATIGYGSLSPGNLAANILVTLEALLGGLGFALSTGLVFARFSRPNAKILFSENALIAPFKEKTAFEFRIINAHSNQLIDVHATVVLSRLETHHGKRVRRFHQLPLEREQVMFFPLHWVIVHPIDESSPLFDLTAQDLEDSDAEFMVLLTAVDETFSQSVHARSSYKHNEIVWGAKFADMFTQSEEGLAVDMRRLHNIQNGS